MMQYTASRPKRTNEHMLVCLNIHATLSTCGLRYSTNIWNFAEGMMKKRLAPTMECIE